MTAAQIVAAIYSAGTTEGINGFWAITSEAGKQIVINEACAEAGNVVAKEIGGDFGQIVGAMVTAVAKRGIDAYLTDEAIDYSKLAAAMGKDALRGGTTKAAGVYVEKTTGNKFLAFLAEAVAKSAYDNLTVGKNVGVNKTYTKEEMASMLGVDVETLNTEVVNYTGLEYQPGLLETSKYNNIVDLEAVADDLQNKAWAWAGYFTGLSTIAKPIVSPILNVLYGTKPLDSGGNTTDIAKPET